VNTSQPNRLVLDLPTLEEWKAELTYVVGCVPRRFTCQQTVTHPSGNRAQCRATTLIETNVLNALTTTPRSPQWRRQHWRQSSNYNSLPMEFSTPSQGVNTLTFVQHPWLHLLIIPPNSCSQGLLNVTFTVLSWSMTRHDTRDLPRTDPGPELDTLPSFKYQKNTLIHTHSFRELTL